MRQRELFMLFLLSLVLINKMKIKQYYSFKIQ